MKINLIPIGNSRGIRIPRTVIEQCGFGDQVEMRVEGGVVVLAPTRGTRDGWETAFERMAAEGDDASLLPDTVDPDWDDTEWEW